MNSSEEHACAVDQAGTETTPHTSGVFLTYRHTMETPDGPFTIVASTWDTGDSAVIASGWTADEDDLLPLVHEQLRPNETVPATALGSLPDIVREAGEAVDDYYAGDLTAPQRVPVIQSSGPFTTGAWQAMRTIAPGAPDSYTEFAERSGNVKAVRAAGAACAKNAVALFVPCHRVVKTGGQTGNFRWGTAIKKSLLARERQAASQ